MFMVGACGVHWAHGPNNVISVDIKESHFEFRVSQELTKGHMDFSVLNYYYWILHPEKHGFRNQNLVSIYPF